MTIIQRDSPLLCPGCKDPDERSQFDSTQLAKNEMVFARNFEPLRPLKGGSRGVSANEGGERKMKEYEAFHGQAVPGWAQTVDKLQS